MYSAEYAEKGLIRLKETLKHAEAFESYYKKGRERSLRELAKELGVSEPSVYKWSKAFKWQERIEERDGLIAERVAEKNIQEEVDLRSKFTQGIKSAVDVFLTNLNQGSVKVESIQDFERLGKLFLEFEKAAAVNDQSAHATPIDKPKKIVFDIDGEPDKAKDLAGVPVYDSENVYLNRLIPKKYNKAVYEILFAKPEEREFKDFPFIGGRHGLRSTVLNICAVASVFMGRGDSILIRETMKSIRRSCFADCKKQIKRMGLDWAFTWSEGETTTMVIKCTENNNSIHFSGFDDPEKLRSLSEGEYGIGLVGFEECQVIKSYKKIRDFRLTIRRGNNNAAILFCGNVPCIKSHFINTKINVPGKGKLLVNATYLDCPDWWVANDFLEEVEEIKRTDYEAYLNEIMGQVVASKGLVFRNIRDWTDGLKYPNQYLFRGLDFGYENDPTAYTVWSYDKATDSLFCLHEAGGSPMYAEMIEPYIKKENKFNNPVIADAASLESIRILSQHGVNVEKCRKPKESVKLGVDWLKKRKNIYIDPNKCPFTYKEFTEYSYETDKEGNSLGTYPDKDNHFIDSTRYALQSVILEV